MDLKLIPRISEKSYAQSQAGTYIFVVPNNANKASIISAITAQYGVKVVDVRTVVAKGKVKRSYRKGGSPVIGRRNDVKKAYVRLAEGDTIAMFAEEKK